MTGRPRHIGASPALILILVCYLLITVGYSVFNPLFEAPDEHWHFFTAEHIASTRSLPVVAEPPDEWMGQEAAQPPLYYLLGALILAPVDTEGAREQVWLNPFAWIGNAAALTNVNRFVHTTLEAWPWQGYALGAHLLRGMSALFGLGTLLCTFASGRLLWPSNQHSALLATALVAFLPQFGFVHGAISNDALITFLCSAALWQLLRLWQTHVTRRRLLLLGVTVGLAVLSKNAGVLLLLFAAGALLVLAIRDKRPQILGETLLFVILPVLLLGGWLWWRNWMLYGDFTASNQFVQLAGGDRDYTLSQVLGESDGLWLSFIAVFGWFNVRAPNWLYLIWSGGVILALVGLFMAAYQGVRNRRSEEGLSIRQFISSTNWFPPVLLGVWLLLVYAGLVMFMLRTEAAQGRLLFPAILPVALGMAYGLGRFRWRGAYPAVTSLAFATTAYCLVFVVEPVYSRPPQVNTVPTGTDTIAQDMGQGLTLLAAKVETTTAEPGDPVTFTLFWQAESVPAEPPEFVLEIFGRDLALIGNSHSYHGRGLYPANLWPQGKIVADRFAVRVSEEAVAPALAWAQARLVGQLPTAVAGDVKVIPYDWPTSSDKALASLGESIDLVAVTTTWADARPGDTITIDVTWRVASAPGADFTTLIHLGESGKPPLATGDAPPLQGDYPTRAWAAGEVIEDEYTIRLPPDLPSGRYPLWIGMYDASGNRLPLSVNDIRQAGDVHAIGWLDVEN